MRFWPPVMRCGRRDERALRFYAPVMSCCVDLHLSFMHYRPAPTVTALRSTWLTVTGADAGRDGAAGRAHKAAEP